MTEFLPYGLHDKGGSCKEHSKNFKESILYLRISSKSLAIETVFKNSPSDPEISGPGMLTRIRNAWVHSKRAKRNKRSILNQDHLFEAAQLTLWYLELVLLRWMEYDGDYVCRWKKDGVVKPEPVPWKSLK